MLFGFLINIRQVQVMLQHCWALQMMHKGSVDHLAPVWQLRSHMAFLIDKIQYYVQVDVIESQFSLLLENIRSTQDFETIQQAHCNFVSSLYRQLFLQATSVSTLCHTHICRYAHTPPLNTTHYVDNCDITSLVRNTFLTVFWLHK